MRDHYHKRPSDEAITAIKEKTKRSKTKQHFIPFIEEVRPYISRNQNGSCGLDIISLKNKVKNEDKVIGHGLSPLLEKGILTGEERAAIIGWFLKNKLEGFQKKISVGGIDYELITDVNEHRRALALIIPAS